MHHKPAAPREATQNLFLDVFSFFCSSNASFLQSLAWCDLWVIGDIYSRSIGGLFACASSWSWASTLKEWFINTNRPEIRPPANPHLTILGGSNFLVSRAETHLGLTQYMDPGGPQPNVHGGSDILASLWGFGCDRHVGGIMLAIVRTNPVKSCEIEKTHRRQY